MKYYKLKKRQDTTEDKEGVRETSRPCNKMLQCRCSSDHAFLMVAGYVDDWVNRIE